MGLLPALLAIVSNSVLLASIPMHFLLFRALWRLKKKLNNSFHVLVRHISALSLICSVLRLVVELPSTHYPLDQVIPNHATLSNIVGYLIDVGSAQLGMSINGIHALTAVNRLMAIAAPNLYQKTMTSRVAYYFCVLSTTSVFLIRLPCLWPVGFVPWDPQDNVTSVVYILSDINVTTIYAYCYVLPVGVITTVIIYVCYISIGIRITWSTILHSAHLQKSVKKATSAAAISSLGAILAVTILLLEQVFWSIWRVDFLDVEWYQAIFGLGVCFNLSVHPWCLMAIFPDIRRQMFFSQGVKPKNSMVVTVGPSSVFTRT